VFFGDHLLDDLAQLTRPRDGIDLRADRGALTAAAGRVVGCDRAVFVASTVGRAPEQLMR
jgi:hypothetical protein